MVFYSAATTRPNRRDWVTNIQTFILIISERRIPRIEGPVLLKLSQCLPHPPKRQLTLLTHKTVTNRVSHTKNKNTNSHLFKSHEQARRTSKLRATNSCTNSFQGHNPLPFVSSTLLLPKDHYVATALYKSKYYFYFHLIVDLAPLLPKVLVTTELANGPPTLKLI